ncbi:thiol reductant ABC exporter subunit CydD [Mesorhizobium sp. J428]|uniref:thiol reductant ABC exporter subunit CydD n=1 Tax=Mesorhizobium sp. J428 TaxID=2898440 RepID=UPI00215136EC|nr:thiol reductant ABC exporter subunit CydD [Mesorhizobium sp. J428]MCR5857314.1 thiol reductant ABC exporter subunit CydD [Mesorhizobium sp. J428]
MTAAEPYVTRRAPASASFASAEEAGALVRPRATSRLSARTGTLLQAAAALLWIPQAGLIAMVIGGIAAGEPARAALVPAAAVFLLGLLRAGLEWAGVRMAFDAARKQLSDLRAEAIAAVADRSPLDMSAPSSGLVASAIAEQAEAVVPYLARFQPLRFKAVVVPLAILACVLAFSWVAALILLVAAPLIPLFMALIGWGAKEASERQLARMGDMNAFLLDRLRGLATIRTFDAVDRTALRLRADAEDLRTRTMAVLRIAFLSSAVLELFAALGVAMVAVYVGFHFLGQLEFGAWGGKLSLAQGLFVLMLAPAFFEPLRDLSTVWHDRAAGQAGLEAVEKMAVRGMPIVGSAAGEARPAERGIALSVTAEDLSFRYPGRDSYVLAGFDLNVRPGEHVALVAPSGAGKSTILALLAGLAPVSGGVIRIGGEPLNTANAARLRASMAWIGQPPHIFPGTVASNVSLGRPDVGAREIAVALKVARLDGVAARRGPSPVGENGVGLSGGEALRLAIARAAAGPDKGLILADEPTAHLDSSTASEVTESLLAAAAGRTLVVATHDPVLAGRMDRIIDLSHRRAEATA